MAAGHSMFVASEHIEGTPMLMIFSILVALVTLYWLGSLAYQYLSNPAERSRLNQQPGQWLLALLGLVLLVMLVVGIVPAYGNLSILFGDHQIRIWTVGLVGCIIVTVIHFLLRLRA